jgi:hypothetical protein
MMRWAGHVEPIEETRNANSEEKKPVRRSWRTWEGKVKWILRK